MSVKYSLDIDKLLTSVQLPDFIRDEGRGYADREGVQTYAYRGWKLPYYVRFTSPDIVLVLDYSEKVSTSAWRGAGGHTYFLMDGTWLCFDRTGIDDSFSICGDDAKSTETVIAALNKQIERVKSYKKQVKAAGPTEVVPGTHWSVTAKTKAEITKKLKNKCTHHFTPYGMGQGLMISAKKYSYSTSRPDIAAFFGVPRVYTSSTDCD